MVESSDWHELWNQLKQVKLPGVQVTRRMLEWNDGYDEWREQSEKAVRETIRILRNAFPYLQYDLTCEGSEMRAILYAYADRNYDDQPYMELWAETGNDDCRTFLVARIRRNMGDDNTYQLCEPILVEGLAPIVEKARYAKLEGSRT